MVAEVPLDKVATRRALPKVLLLAIGLLLVGGALVLADLQGSFDTSSCPPWPCSASGCAPEPPTLCSKTPNLWPGFVGSALWVTGLALILAWFVDWRKKGAGKGRPSRPAGPTSTPEKEERAPAMDALDDPSSMKGAKDGDAPTAPAQGRDQE